MDIDYRNIIKKSQHQFHPVISLDHGRLALLDLTANNQELSSEILDDTDLFNEYIEATRKKKDADFLIGGYNELRAVYGRSDLFNGNNKAYIKEEDLTSSEPRRLHLGTDIWGTAGTPIFAPLGGMIHSFAFNNHYGDYGATIVLLHQLDGFAFYTLYGHLSLKDIDHLNAGDYVIRGAEFAHFGESHENGHWPPHLHLQIIVHMELYQGDYPGVCRFSEREKYLANCPDPDLILQMNKYAKA